MFLYLCFLLSILEAAVDLVNILSFSSNLISYMSRARIKHSHTRKMQVEINFWEFILYFCEC